MRRQSSFAKSQASNCLTRSNFWVWLVSLQTSDFLTTLLKQFRFLFKLFALLTNHRHVRLCVPCFQQDEMNIAHSLLVSCLGLAALVIHCQNLFMKMNHNSDCFSLFGTFSIWPSLRHSLFSTFLHIVRTFLSLSEHVIH